MNATSQQPVVPAPVRQTQRAFDETYTGLIDVSDFGNRPLEKAKPAFRSRALAAHAVRIMTGWTPEQAADCVIDGGQDQGIDAVAIDEAAPHIYLVQAKWSPEGTAKADEIAVHRLFAGLTLIDSGEAAQFNPRGQILAKRAHEMISEKTTRITQVIALMGTKPPSPGVKQVIKNGEREFNSHGDYVDHKFLHAPEIHALVMEDQRSEPVKLEATLRPWFNVPSPYLSYEGVIQAEEVASWAKHGNELFARNIRNPLGLTPINKELVETLTDEPSHFWYFNNGVTVLCDSLEAVPGSQKFPERSFVRLTAHGASVVNGAQTVRSVIEAAQQTEDAELAQVTVRFIVTGGDAEFANRTTQATNRQNHITDRDRIALDPVQAVLIEEFRAELGLVYSVRRSELEPQDDEGCSVVEAACALACAHIASRFAARLVASSSTDVLWERGSSGIYDPLFRSVPNVYEIWNAVNVLRAVRTALRTEREQYAGRAAAVIDDGSFLITHLVFRQLLAQDAGMGEPDQSLAWLAAAKEQVADLVKRIVPVLVQVLDEEVGTRTGLQRACADPGQTADLVTAVLTSLEGGTSADAAAKYRRQENKPRKRRRPNAVHVIVDRGVLEEGAPLHLALYLQPEKEALAAWLDANPRRGLAKWTNTNRARPIVWAADGIAYSPSGLIARMWELAEWEGRPVSNQGTARWATQDGETLAVLARRLLDSMAEEKDTE
ncbi:AIPR family protein [Streptomyces sp. DSM 42041]|uniref:AIPR family protein n=1 Tax=Streptomyces hazeniae TaxID=3075538 RepID=A0ABU2NRM4_9ACTN|nr:AIPR family protein [Streptomyces sp. DSM 42041]MDT0379390.1 AIPR family protein [Streptomyces sp. DSM 42041]